VRPPASPANSFADSFAEPPGRDPSAIQLRGCRWCGRGRPGGCCDRATRAQDRAQRRGILVGGVAGPIGE